MGVVAFSMYRVDKKSQKWNFKSSSSSSKTSFCSGSNNSVASFRDNTTKKDHPTNIRNNNNNRSSFTSQSSCAFQRPKKNTNLKSKVIFQCALYLISMYLAWIPYLSLTI